MELSKRQVYRLIVGLISLFIMIGRELNRELNEPELYKEPQFGDFVQYRDSSEEDLQTLIEKYLTPVPDIVTPYTIALSKLERGRFETNGGQLDLIQKYGSCPHGTQISWEVSEPDSRAGSVVNLGYLNLASPVYTHLLLHVESTASPVQFGLGLISGEDQQHAEPVSLSENGWITIPLAVFAAHDVNLRHITGLVLIFEDQYGDESRQGSICIDRFGFGSP